MDKHIHPDIDAELDEGIALSKSAVKKALQDILAFAEMLLTLSTSKLAKLPLSELLRSELELARKLKNDNSRRRQMQRIAKILRKENYDDVKLAYDSLSVQDRQHQQSTETASQWCERLIQDPNTLAEFIEHYPNNNRQQLSQLIRNINKEKEKANSSQKNRSRLVSLIQEILIHGPRC